MRVLGRYPDAEASYTVAMMLDIDNPEYRRQVKDTRRLRGR
jgi:hypothetical protein